jgi:asparagine synthase (glutamine-hydrolysing)
MSDYIVLAWGDDALARGQTIKDRLVADGAWRLVVDRQNMAVFLSRVRPLPHILLSGQTGLIIGPVFDTALALSGCGRVADLSGIHGGDAATLCRRLIKSAWGSYVAVLPDGDGAPNVFRDPLGGLECLTWRRDEVFVAASRLDPAAPHAPRALAIDWRSVAALLRQKNLSSVTVPLTGVTGVDPGVLQCADGSLLRLWRPAEFARNRAVRRNPRPEDLASVVDGCVAAWATGRSGILCEVSGGLDSAILVAALRRARAPVVAGLNHYWPQPEADERGFARLVAEQAGLELTERPHGLLSLDAGKLAQIAGAARPSFSGADPNYDADMAARLGEAGVDSLFTGQGGDAVFYQMATAALAGDLLRGVPSGRSWVCAMTLLAHRTRRTAWSLLLEAARTWRAPVASQASVSFLTEAAARGGAADRHPWLGDLKGVSPAKQIQIQALANNQSMFGDSLRSRAGRLIQPLLSQPVVEFCLSVPAPILAIGVTDRPFARAAFADRLPPAVLHRRWKGDLSVFFAQSMAESLPFLRSFLLEGRLVAHGLIDPRRLEPILHRDELIWFDHSGELTIAVVIEAWVRHWEASLARAPGQVGELGVGPAFQRERI